MIDHINDFFFLPPRSPSPRKTFRATWQKRKSFYQITRESKRTSPPTRKIMPKCSTSPTNSSRGKKKIPNTCYSENGSRLSTTGGENCTKCGTIDRTFCRRQALRTFAGWLLGGRGRERERLYETSVRCLYLRKI